MDSKAMTWRPYFFVMLVTVAGLLALHPRAAFACSCIPPVAPAQERDRASAVFAGKVATIDAPFDLVASSVDPVKVTFDVTEVWKGPAYRRLVLTTARSGASCGYSFQPGETYLVYAFDQGDGLTTHACTRNNILAQAQDDRAALGTSTAPSIDNPGAPASSNLLLPLLGLVIGMLLAVAGAALVLRKQRSRYTS